MKKVLIPILCLLSSVFVSCSVNMQDIYIIDEIHVSDDVEENKKIGNDLISYEYATMLYKEQNITDNEVLKNITYQYFVSGDGKTVTFRLLLNGKAKEYKNVILPFFENFVRAKLVDYKEKKEYLDKAIVQSGDIIEFMQENKQDSVWNMASPNLLTIVTKEKFLTEIEKMHTQFNLQGERSIKNRLLYSELNGFNGDFYVITYQYPNKMMVQVILERINDDFKLLGYHVRKLK